jgi:nucleoside-diphosphate-sugar epimerase
LASLTAWFIDHTPKHKAYNVCTGKGVALTEIAHLVAEISARNPPIVVRQPGLAPEYTGDNSRLLAETGGWEFHEPRRCIRKLYHWYADHEELFDLEMLRFDE